MRNRNSTMLRVLAMVLAVAMLAGAFIGCSKKEKTGGKDVSVSGAISKVEDIDKVPKKASDKLSNTLLNTVNEAAGNKTVSYVQQIANGGSITIEFDAADLIDEMLGEDIPLSALMSIYTDADDSFGAIMLKAALDGDIFADASVYSKGSELILHSDSILRDKAYGLNLEKDLDALYDLVYEMTGVDLEEEIYYALGMDLTDLADMMEAGEAAASELSAYVDRFVVALAGALDIVAAAVEENDGLKEKSETYTVGSQDIKVNKLTLEIDSSNLPGIFEDSINGLAKYKELHDLILDLGKYLEDNADTFGIDFDYDDFEEIVEEVYDTLGDAEEVADAAEMMEDVDVEISGDLYLSQKDNSLVAMDLYIYDGYDEIEIGLVLGEDPATSEEVSLTVAFDGEEMEIGWYVDENSDSEYIAHTEMYIPYVGEPLSLEVEWDKKSGDFEVTFEYDDGYDYAKIILEGNRIVNGKTDKLTISEVTYKDDYDKMTLPVNVTITVNTGVKMPSAPKYTNVTKLDEDDIYDLADQIYEDVEDMVADLEDQLF